MKGNLFVISAPSGTGKTSLVKKLVETAENLLVSVSYTTRPQRVGEVEGKHYHFITETVFHQMVEQGKFLEYAEIYQYHYGTGSDWVENCFNEGKDIILEIDWQGAAQIKKLVANTIGVFILPPAPETLRERLMARDLDNIEVINQRLEHSNQEIQHYREYDYLVINDDFDVALADLQAIIRANRLNQPLQSLVHMDLIAKFMA